jgi:phosphatidylserine decarboxylase
MVIDTPYGKILLKQIAGILARRCVSYAQVGNRLPTGQRFGLIKFGSRVDLFLPSRAQILVAAGDKVYGGLTPVAFFPDERSQHEA